MKVFFICVAAIISLSLAQSACAVEADGYNVVMVFLDALRADHLKSYGYGRETAPALESVAADSFVFEQAYSTASYTNASFTSINTSLYPASHGVREVIKDILPTRVRTLAQILSLYGYTTAWFGPRGDPHLSSSMGIDRGFGESNMVYFPRACQEAAALRRWLRSHRDEKFFLNFHTYRIHAPWLPAPEYKAVFVDAGKKNPFPGPDDRAEYFRWWSRNAKKVSAGSQDVFETFSDYFSYWRSIDFSDPAVNAHIQGLYDACLLEYDQEVLAPVIAELRALGLYDRTIIVFCSDHGEEFYEHRGCNHGYTLYDEVLRVPLIIRVPGMPGGRIRELAQTVDILPTILGLLRIRIPQQAQGKDWSSCLMRGDCAPRREYAFSQNYGMSSLRSKEWKFIRDGGGKKELFDLIGDPGEQTDVCGSRPAECARFEAQLAQWESGLRSYVEEDPQYPSWVREKTKEKIRKSGYW